MFGTQEQLENRSVMLEKAEKKRRHDLAVKMAESCHHSNSEDQDQDKVTKYPGRQQMDVLAEPATFPANALTKSVFSLQNLQENL